MRSTTPKVLHPLCGRPMILHVLDTLVELPLQKIVVVVGHGAEQVTKVVHEQLATEMPIEFVEQRVQRGTGDAASVGLTPFADSVDAEDDVLVLTADTPLLRAETLAALATEHRLTEAAATLARGGARRPDRLRAHHPGRPRRRRPDRRAGRRQRGRAGDHRDQPVDLLLPAQPTSRPRCGGSARRTRRASTTSPTRSRCCASTGHLVVAVAGRRPHRDARRQRPRAARRPRSTCCGFASTSGGCAKASR